MSAEVSSKRRHALAIAVFIACVAVDRASKLLAQASLAEHQSVTLIPGFFYITLTYNTGIAFGMLQNTLWLIVPISTIVIIGTLVYYLRLRRTDRLTDVLLAMLLAGAAANLYDRIVYGRVTDMLHIRWWPVFNVADTFICVSGFLLVVKFLFLSSHSTVAEQSSE